MKPITKLMKEKSPPSPSAASLARESGEPFETGNLPTGPTGRYLVTMRDGDHQAFIRELKNVAGLSAASTADWENAEGTEADIDQSALVFEHIGVAVVDADPNQMSSLSAAVKDSSSPIIAVEQEEFVHAFAPDEPMPTPSLSENPLLTPAGVNYLHGYQDAIAALVARVGVSEQAETEISNYGEIDTLASYSDTTNLTWGLQATRASNTFYTGSGMRIAVLDTGIDLGHPDFVGRTFVVTSFVPGESVQDGHGHGTHCIGTSCGPKLPAGTARRYGVATDASIMAAKVLNNAGSGVDAWILAGINWAIQNKATIISMSLGAPVAVGGTFKQAYEQAAIAAMNAGTLVVAAAGNAGNNPVGSPANCPSIMGVAAVDQNLQRASFSCLGINPNGGEINIAGPGVAVFSSTKMPTRYASFSGTSMATPHVAGCAALWAQRTGLRGKPLWDKLINSARPLGQPVPQVGAGLVQAPLLFVLPPVTRPKLAKPPFPMPLP